MKQGAKLYMAADHSGICGRVRVSTREDALPLGELLGTASAAVLALLHHADPDLSYLGKGHVVVTGWWATGLSVLAQWISPSDNWYSNATLAKLLLTKYRTYTVGTVRHSSTAVPKAWSAIGKKDSQFAKAPRGYRDAYATEAMDIVLIKVSLVSLLPLFGSSAQRTLRTTGP